MIEVYETDIKLKGSLLINAKNTYLEHLTLVNEIGWTRKEISKLQSKNIKIEQEITLLTDLQK